MTKPVNSSYCSAPQAQAVFLAGDFNRWQPRPMQRQPDESWRAAVRFPHSHHRYWFLVDGQPVLDTASAGIDRNERGEQVSLIAVSRPRPPR